MNEQEHLTTSDLAEAQQASAEAGTASAPSQPTGDVVAPAAASQSTPPASGGESAADRRSEPADESGTSPLFDQSDRSGFQERWKTIQTGFVDEPRRSVEQADALVAEAMNRLAEMFARERQALETQWGAGTDVSTEDLRVALQRYRSFFERLLAA